MMPSFRPAVLDLPGVRWEPDLRAAPVLRSRMASGLQVYRVLCWIAVGVLLAFGFAYRLAGQSAQEPLWPGLVLVAAALALVGASYRVPVVRRRLSVLVQALFYLTTFWFIVAAALNAFTADYAIGLLFIIPSMGVSYSLSLRRLTPLAWYFVATVLVAILAWSAASGSGIASTVFIGSLSCVSLVTFLVAGARIQMQERFEATEQRYQAVVEQASDGIYLLDAATLRFLDANPAFQRMVGFTLEELQEITIFDLIVQEPSLVNERLRFVLTEKDVYVAEQVLRRSDGSEVWVDLRVDCISYRGRELLSVLVQDITQRKQYEERLIVAKTRAEEIARFKSTLLANVSHEVRTPLSGILGWAAVLKEEVPADQQELVQFIEQSGRRLYESLNAVIELASLDANTKEPDLTVLDAAEEIGNTLDLLEPQARQKGLALVYEHEGALPARLDAPSLQRIVTHLVDNAIKFTPSGSVRVDLAARGADLRLSVSDTGVGIGEAFLPHLFEEFKQESEGLARDHEGNGLGLAITKRLVERLGGDITVESERGRGATFTVTFPGSVAERSASRRARVA